MEEFNKDVILDNQEEESIEDDFNKNGEDELFQGGPTYDQVADWKSQYDEEIYMSSFGEDTYIWRPLRRKEYKDIQKIENADEYYVEEQICMRCVLWPSGTLPQKLRAGKAGIPTMLSRLIMDKSGFVRPSTFKI